MAIKSTKKPSKTTKKASASKKTKFSKAQYIDWYKQMLLMRKMEEKISQLYIQQKFSGFCHVYNGQEAVVAGTVSGSKKGDIHVTAYRDHVHPIALGVEPKHVMAELYGKKTGVSKGLGGSMHMFDKEHGFYGGHAIVGAQIPLGAGLAFSEKYKGTKNVVFTSFGDGAFHQGALHETFNMAMVWKLPVVFIIENNNYGMGTSVERASAVIDFTRAGTAYKMPSFTVNGMVPEDVHEAIKMAANRARNGEGPTLLNIKTYRYKGHSTSDPGNYRTKEEVAEYKKKDPINHCLNIINNNKFLSDKELDTIKENIDNTIKEAIKFAEESEALQPEDLYKYVYKTENYPFIKEEI